MKENDQKKIFKVYKYTLKNDGRVYIGQTCCSLKERAGSNGHRYKNCIKFYNAIKKYGWENFIPEIIQDNLTAEEANLLETEKILQYNSIEKGFNLAKGGGNRIPTEETRLKQSLAKRGQKNNRYGVKLSQETKKKIGEANKISQLGKKHSEQTKKKMSDSHRSDKYIECIETGEIFQGPAMAGKAMGKEGKSPGSHISECCMGKRKTAFKYHWRYTTKEKYDEWNQLMRKMAKE